MPDVHAKRELEVFRSFAVARGWGSAANAEKRQPPEPDLLVRAPDHSQIAMELVEILGEDYGGMIGSLLSTKTALSSHYDALSDEKRIRFTEQYGNALLFFRFAEYSTLNQRTQKMAAAFDKLLTLPRRFSGESLMDDPDLLPTLSGVSISRGQFNGPVFDPQSVRSLGDPTSPAIAKKFAKKYVTAHPLELLAYIDGQPMFPDDVWRGNLEEYLSAQSKPYPFTKIWVLDIRRETIVGEYTADDF